MIIDTHSHLNDLEAYPDPSLEIQFAQSVGVTRVVVVGTHPEDWASAIDLAERFDEVYAVVGWHPNYTADYSVQRLESLWPLLSHPRVIALGEIGLDYYREQASQDIQKAALDAQLEMAKQANLPIVFHGRNAYDDLLERLERRGPGPYLLHCFAGTGEQAARAVTLGAYFGFDGPVTYKKADDLRALISTLPRDRIVAETDAPYLTPVPFRGKPNRPGYVRYVVEALAKLWEVPSEEAAGITTANAKRFFPKLD